MHCTLTFILKPPLKWKPRARLENLSHPWGISHSHIQPIGKSCRLHLKTISRIRRIFLPLRQFTIISCRDICEIILTGFAASTLQPPQIRSLASSQRHPLEKSVRSCLCAFTNTQRLPRGFLSVPSTWPFKSCPPSGLISCLSSLLKPLWPQSCSLNAQDAFLPLLVIFCSRGLFCAL